ncbi:hypothetical protein DFH11DRAFT_1553938 [Phellopilus nigrolimitatus]|nr:hypothetical protein DFH11DRAFT_1553938 [Phellopilus nigrolimitatus]
MSIPKFFNPHSAAIGYASSSRSEIFADSEGISLTSTENVDVSEDISWLEEHIRSSLVPGEQTPARLKHHKRRIPNAEDVEESMGLPEFRLLSSNRTSRPIYVQPKPPKIIKVVEREHEDNAERAELRRHRAQEAAVDFPWLLAQSRLKYPKFSRVISALRNFAEHAGYRTHQVYGLTVNSHEISGYQIAA